MLRLIEYLAKTQPTEVAAIDDWQVHPVLGGHNNLLYHVSNSEHNLAIKFTRRDERRRAQREFNALALLDELGLEIAPRALFLDEEGYDLPLVIQSWLPGENHTTPPQSHMAWQHLLDHYSTIHSITPDMALRNLAPAWVTYVTAADGLRRIQTEFAKVPGMALSPELDALVKRIISTKFPTWPEPKLVLCRTDPNILNFVRRPTRWASVDWENSGWGDPAFEIADLMAHPAYKDVSMAKWDWFVEAYCKGNENEFLPVRIHTYYCLLLVHWALLFARLNHQLAHNSQKKRLVERPAGWAKEVPVNYQHYATVAIKNLDAYSL